MAICLAIQKLKDYLVGHHFVVRIDQQSLRHLILQREVSVEYQKWMRKILGLDFEVQYKPGVANCIADALSRKTGEPFVLGAMLTTSKVDWKELEMEISIDTTIQRIHQQPEQNKKSQVGFHVVDNKVMYKGRHVIPRKSRFIPILLQEYHDSVVGGIMVN